MAGLFYVDTLPDVDQSVSLHGDDGFHAAAVRRIRPGEQLTVGDGAGRLACCAVQDVGRAGLTARVVSRWDVAPPSPPVTVVQALPKSERSELAVELATEAGADQLVAWQAARCVARWDGTRVDRGLRRWRVVARAAAAQSRRAYIPPVTGVLPTAALAEWTGQQVAAGTVVLALHETATVGLADVPVADAPSVAVVVGPEGGISDDEIVALAAAGAVAVRLGPTVLRTSTAAAVALGALGTLTTRWRPS